MKNLFATIALGMLPYLASAQVNVTFKPDPSLGDNTTIMTSYGCILSGYPAPFENINVGSVAELGYGDWTYNAGGCPQGTQRSLIRFNEVSTIPQGATILSAQLNLLGVPSSVWGYGNSIHPGSPFTLPNDGVVNQVTSPWSAGTVTWATQPSVSSPTVSIPVTTMRFNENFYLPVTAMVQNMVSTGNNYGFMTSLQIEGYYYKSVIFAGNAHSDATLWPELVISYCDPSFTYCTNSTTPYTVSFTANTITAGQDYEWSVDGTVVGYGTSINHFFGGAGSYKVCLQILTADGERLCERCINLCLNDNGEPVPPSDGLAAKSPGAGNHVIRAAMPAGDKVPVINNSRISPNPTRNAWDIKVDNGKQSGNKATITLYDINGKLLQQQTKVLNAGENIIRQNAASLTPGTYLLEISNGDNTWKEKVVKE